MKKYKLLPVMLAAVAMLTACGAQQTGGRTVQETETAAQAYGEDKEAYRLEENTEQVRETAEQKELNRAERETGPVLQDGVLRETLIYYSNSRADGLEAESIQLDKLGPEELLERLAAHNIVSMDTKVNRVELKEELPNRSGTALYLDLNQAFMDYLNTMSADGENILLAALANTFLEAYDADILYVTVEGDALVTGNRTYEKGLMRREADAGN